MAFDTWTIAAVAEDLNRTILGGRVQQIVQIDEASFGFEVYASRQRRYLIASANRQAPRLHLISDKPRRGVDTATPMLQLLRKFVRGSRIAAISQPAWERILELEFEHPEHGSVTLMAELIGRWANLLLLRPAIEAAEPGALRILECVRRVRPANSSARTRLPGRLYMPPPPQAGWPPDSLTELRLRLLLEDANPQTPLWQVLLQGLQGLSPHLAREIAYRATGRVQTVVGQVQRLSPILEAVAEFVGLLEEGSWQPGLVLNAEGQVVAFAVYPPRHQIEAEGGTWQPLGSISQAAERYYAQITPVAADPYAVARQQVAAAIKQAQRRLQQRREAIQRELRPVEEIEQLRLAGEWILALATQVKPGQVELQPPPDSGLEPNVIRLDPALSPADNAASYFKRYRKAKRASETAQERLADVDAELAYLEQLTADLALATNRNEIDAVRAALVEAGYLRLPDVRIVSHVKGPRRFTSREGYPILVGRNSRQNDRLTFQQAAADDLWLHARDWPGSHVIIRSGGRPVSEETLRQAAQLAAYYSQGRDEAWVDVMVTERRHVRRAPGKRPGMVTVRRERVLRVRPEPPSLPA